MSKNKFPNEQPIPPTHYQFYLGSRERYIHISCDFQSGNIQLVRQLTQFNYRLSCIDDALKTQHRTNSKSWFYFNTYGFPKNTKAKFAVSRVQTLMAIYTHASKSYRPVYRDRMMPQGEWSQWTRIPTECPLILRQNGQLQCVFEFPFRNEHHQAEFAFAYPYSYSRNIEYLNSLNEYYYHDEFYFHKEILIHSPQHRQVHLLTLTSHDQPNNQAEHQELFNEALFPQKCRPKSFKKPVILISARVHPGQTAASFTLEGIINFLINNQDVRSYLLKKMFVFMIVPMINVDGVYHGHFRMDSYGKNLNRYYSDPSAQAQPAVYAIKELANHLTKNNRLAFYFDLHAHNAKKGAFIYGNAINDFVQQVESQVFCKLFALNHSGFEYEFCNFSQKQMNSKDKNQDRTKEGCGRVVMHRLANIIHSYSLECGIISAVKVNPVPIPMNHTFQLGTRQLIESQQSQSSQPTFFTQQSYRQLGKSLLVSILDVFDKNPYNRIYNSSHKSMQFLRRVTAFEVFHTAERFRMFQKYVYGKVKNINELIREVLNSKLHYRQLYNFYFYNDKELKNSPWPQNIPGLIKPKFAQKLKRFRSLQQPKLEYSLSFLQDLKTNRDQLEQTTKLFCQYPPLEEELNSCSSQTENEEQQRNLDEEYYKQIMETHREVHSETLIPFEQMPDIEQEFSRKSNSQHYNQTYEGKGIYCQKEIEDREKEELNSHFFNLEEKSINLVKGYEKTEDIQSGKIKMAENDSPSMRVRRLLKNDIPKKPKISTQDMKVKLRDMIANSPQMGHNSFLTSNTLSNYSGHSVHSVKSEKQGSDLSYPDKQIHLFEEIKKQIREQLRRHKERTALICTSTKSPSKPLKNSIGQIKQRQRIKSTNLNFLNLNLNVCHHKHRSETLNRIPSKSSVIKTQLPSLNSHILIITSNSSKGLTHND